MDTRQPSVACELKSELAQFCLPSANRDPNRKLAWTNSICLLFLLLGGFGFKPGAVVRKPVPPLEEVIPTVVEPVAPPPQTTTETADPEREPSDQDQPSAAPVVAVALPSPSINFAVPTVGNLVVPAALAQAPPVRPLQPKVAAKPAPINLSSTGKGGERPQPPYPQLALELGQQGSVTLLIQVDEAGLITAVDLKESSGFPILDRSTLDYVKRHWRIPPGTGSRVFETTIHYRLRIS